jgi:hypothetical protein
LLQQLCATPRGADKRNNHAEQLQPSAGRQVLRKVNLQTFADG